MGSHGSVPRALGRLKTLINLDLDNNKVCESCNARNKVSGDLALVVSFSFSKLRAFSHSLVAGLQISFQNIINVGAHLMHV